MAQRKGTFGPITRTGLAGIRAELAKHEVNLPNEDQGTINGPHGVVVHYSYDPMHQTLTVEVEASLFVVGIAWSTVQDGVSHFVGT